jgi:hypothetical protein
MDANRSRTPEIRATRLRRFGATYKSVLAVEPSVRARDPLGGRTPSWPTSDMRLRTHSWEECTYGSVIPLSARSSSARYGIRRRRPIFV